jgi:hypothetical protein
MTESKLITEAVVQITRKGGRGFIVNAADDARFIITAAHCVPRRRYPRPHLANSINELTVPNLIGPLGAKQCTIWVELCVLNLNDDLAVFGQPDNQDLSDKAKSYAGFTRTGLQVGPAPPIVPPYQWCEVPGSEGYVLSLDSQWQPCTMHNNGRWLALDGCDIKGGMSGSPILNAEGAAIGVISTGYSGLGNNQHPSLADCLPPWLWRELSRTALFEG